MKKLLLSIITFSTLSFANGQTYVNINATGNNDGTSWADAFTDLHDATYNTPSGEIWVAQGTYVPTNKLDGSSTSPIREYTFSIQNDVQVYGGFMGTETTLGQRDWVNNPTILSGDLGGGQKAYNVVRFDGNSNTTIFDGFTVTDGFADATGFLDGAGIYMSNNSQPTIQNCTFTNNSARFGGAITSINGLPKILNCIFKNNTTYQYDGGAIWTEGNVEIVNCLFDGNSASRRGGAIYSAHGSNIQITNNTFVNNNASAGVSSIYFVGTNSSATAYVDNCVFYMNTSAGSTLGTAISYFQLVTLSVENCIFEYGSTQVAAQTQTNLLSGDPLFNDFENGDFTLLCQSPAVNTGNSSSLNIPSNDLIQNPRIFGAAIDMGAFESISQIGITASETTICSGNSVVLNGVCDGGTYTWTNGVIDGVAFYPTSTQTYSCTGSLSGASTQITINVIDIADETITAPTEVCTGSSTTVTTGSSTVDVNYTLQDGSGNVVDGPIVGTGNGLSFNTGTINSTSTYNVVGEFQPSIANHALIFDGVDDEATTNYVHQSSSNFTIEMWIKPNTTSYRRILSNYTGGNVIPGNILIDTYDPTYPGTSFRAVFGGAGSAWSQHIAQNVLTLNTWNHVAVTFDNGTVYLYVNGALANTSSAPFSVVPTSSATTRLGADNPVGTWGFYNGGIDELRFWTTARTASEIVGNMDNCLTGTEPGLDLYYDFETTGTSSITDLVGNSDGALSSSVNLSNAWIERTDGFSCVATCSLTMSQTVTISTSTVDNTTQVTANTITANQNGATYRWLDCNNANAVINGATSQNYTATANGNYAVEVTLNGCVDTSACVNIVITGINELSNTTMSITPNPVKNALSITTNETIKKVAIYNISGSLIKNIATNFNSINVSELSKGMYILVVQTNNGISQNRFIKE
jgi:predicted outer membrane repeat protein